jgi:hypothetical protein
MCPRRRPVAGPRPRERSVKRPRSATIPSASTAGPYDTFAYWLMPHGLKGLLTTVFWPSATSRSSRQNTRGESRSGSRRASRRSSNPAPLGAFPLLAPGKPSRDTIVGEHAFWRGSLWGRTVALQGDSTFTKFDLFELAGDRLLYWGTFRGNGYYGSEDSHSFSSPFVWMDRWMGVGDFKQDRVTDSLLDPRLRRPTGSGSLTLRVEVVAHHDRWRDSDSGTQFTDVLEVHYWSRYPDDTSKEVYHLGKGLGTIRFETFDRAEPSGVHYQYAESFEPFTPPERPANPWFDPFANATHVHNGYFEDFLVPPVPGGPVAAYLRDWLGSPDAVITTDAPDEGTGPWHVALRGSTGGGDSLADFVIVSDWIPVTPGRRYRLSGSVWRVSEADNVYLDFNDGVGQGGSFHDAQALARGAHGWERVAAETTVGPATRGVKVRCVRDGANEGNAYCDGITLQRVD